MATTDSSGDSAGEAAHALALGSDFPVPDHDTWVELATKALKGGSLDKLVTVTADGIELAPVYDNPHIDDPAGLPGAFPFTRGSLPAGRPELSWDIRQHHSDPSTARANTSILNDLERGATSLLLDLDRLGVETLDDLGAVLDGVLLDLAGVHLRPSTTGIAAAHALHDLWVKQGVAPSAALGGLGIDPLAVAARTGAAPNLDDVVSAVKLVAGHPNVRALSVDATPYADAGASDAQEIAYSLATAVEYLRLLDADGVAIDDACAAMSFTYSLGADQFAGIAKLRAARTCWARVAQASGASDDAGAQDQHAVSGSAMLTTRDPWVNLLRVTVACFAAAVGGAQAITTQPFDAAIGVSDEFARRIARNTQLLLLEESNLARVVDPAGGSWFVESLTTELADKAWLQFQAIEAAGGMAAALEAGLVADQIATVAEARAAKVAKRKLGITGVSEFPNIDEESVVREAAMAADGGLPLRRDAEPFEQLRDAAEQASSGGRPKIFLANLGPIADHTARATYAQNFFEVGGIEAVVNDGFATAVEAAEAFAQSDASVAVICSSDAIYADLAASTAEALVGAGATHVVLAGRPGDAQATYEAAGIADFIHMGADVLAALRRTHQILGIGGQS